jgi:hypothetical protein
MAAVVSFTDQKPNKRAKGGMLGKLIITWLSHTDGVATSASIPFNGIIRKITTDPGAAAPTANYDITLEDDLTAEDIAAGTLANRHTTTTEAVVPVLGTYFPVAFAGTFKAKVINSGSAKNGTITVYYE